MGSVGNDLLRSDLSELFTTTFQDVILSLHNSVFLEWLRAWAFSMEMPGLKPEIHSSPAL